MWIGEETWRIGENWKIVRKDRLGWILRVFLRDTSAGGTLFYVYGKTVYAESEVNERSGRRSRRRVSFTLLVRTLKKKTNYKIVESLVHRHTLSLLTYNIHFINFY